LYVLLDSVGDVYIDDLALIALTGPTTGSNLIQNGGFEGPLVGWNFGTNMTNTAISAAVFHFGSNSLHLVAGSSGLPTTNASFWQTLPVITNTVYNLSYWFLPTTNANRLITRFNSNARPESVVKPPILFHSWGRQQCPRHAAAVPAVVVKRSPAEQFLSRHQWYRRQFRRARSLGELYNGGTNELSLAVIFWE